MSTPTPSQPHETPNRDDLRYPTDEAPTRDDPAAPLVTDPAAAGEGEAQAEQPQGGQQATGTTVPGQQDEASQPGV